MDNHLIQNTATWKQFRKKMIGASDAPIIMGVSPWNTPYSLWRLKCGLDDDMPETVPQTYGKLNEDIARSTFQVLIGVEVQARTVISSKIPWMMASMDGLSDDGKIAVELKCPGKKDMAVAMDGIIPQKYFPQLQHQMCVCKLEKMFCFFWRKDCCKILEIDIDYAYVNTLIDKETKFYECMTQGVPPK